MTPRFTLNPLQVDGAVEKSTVEFTVRFTAPPEEEAIPPWTGPEPSEESLSLARVAASRMSALMGDPASEILAELDVDADRVEPVTRMVERVSAAFEGRRIESAALMLARTGDTAQLEALAEGRLPPGSIPSEQAVQAASPEMAAAYRDFERQLREVYCARYACAPAER